MPFFNRPPAKIRMFGLSLVSISSSLQTFSPLNMCLQMYLAASGLSYVQNFSMNSLSSYSFGLLSSLTKSATFCTFGNGKSDRCSVFL